MWFDSRMGDGRIERILPVAADAGKLVPYVFNITTSDIRGAGTDAGTHEGGKSLMAGRTPL